MTDVTLRATQTRDYALVTGAYWVFTVTDGALRTLVLLAFHELGYSPVSLAFLFLLYEAFGVATNLFGGWIGARRGLDQTLFAGLTIQIVALVTMSLRGTGWSEVATVVFVMGAQALSGIAKDLTKMSSKSAVKLVAGSEERGLFRWVALLTGSKNALKGVGFFVGGALLAAVGLASALRLMAAALVVTLVVVLVFLRGDLGRAKEKPPLGAILSKSPAINRLSIARFFLFGARDIWFVVALPVFLADRAGWSFERIGGFLAVWLIGYGIVQSQAPRFVRTNGATGTWGVILAAFTGALAVVASVGSLDSGGVQALLIAGLLVFGVIFAVNSSVHSFMILALSENPDDVALDVGFYYSANAAGRLVGTLLSGVLALLGGLAAALWVAAAFAAVAGLTARGLESTSTA